MVKDDQHPVGKRPLIEWIAGGIGLLITIGLVGFIGWEALQRAPERPQIVVRVTGIAASGDSYRVEITAFNRGSRTVAGLNVEGTLAAAGRPFERSGAVFDYVPGGSQAHGGLYFASDPREGRLEVSAKGYQRP
jgi:uncharacterized protein (TIGR02588 family)